MTIFSKATNMDQKNFAAFPLDSDYGKMTDIIKIMYFK